MLVKDPLATPGAHSQIEAHFVSGGQGKHKSRRQIELSWSGFLAETVHGDNRMEWPSAGIEFPHL
jgi:hypothetical protein